MRIDDIDNIWKLPLYRCICYYLSLSVILHRYPCNTADTSIPSHYCKWKKCCMIVKHLCKSYHFSSQQNKLCDKAEKAIVLPPFFPIFLTIILASFPSGLVVYWTVNNILTIAQQWVIMKKTKIKTN